jgi:flagellar FliL protein
MSDKAKSTADAPSTTEGDATKASKFRKLKIAGFVVGVMLAECAVAYLWLGGEGTSAHAEESGGGSHDKHAKHDDGHGGHHSPGHGGNGEKSTGDSTDGVEILLGEFNVTSFQPQSNSTLRISFQLYATTSLEDEYELKKLLEANKHRVREQVLIIARSATIEDLADPMLTLIKRKISEKVNRLIGKPLVRGAVFSDFSYFEQ